MTNDEITVVLDYLDEQIKILAKNDQKMKERINYLQKQVNAICDKLEEIHNTASSAEAIALTNQLKGLF